MRSEKEEGEIWETTRKIWITGYESREWKLFCKAHLRVQPSHVEMHLLNLQFSVASGVWPSERSDEAPCVASWNEVLSEGELTVLIPITWPNVYLCLCVRACVRVCARACNRACMCTALYVCVWMHECKYVHMCAYVHVCARVYANVRACVRACVRECVCACVKSSEPEWLGLLKKEGGEGRLLIPNSWKYCFF